MDAEDLSGFEGANSQQGQGLAYVLPQSRTTGYFMQLANEKAQERRQQARLLQQQQQKANEEYAQHLYQFKTPEIANEYTKWLQPQYDSLIQQASDYHAKTGQDPFTNPNFVARTNDLNTTAKNTHSMNLKATALGTALADKSKNYTPESKQAAANWLQGYYKDPVTALNTQPPALEQRDLGLNDAIKLGHANSIVSQDGGYTVTAPNTHNHVVQGQEILGQPEFAPMLQKQYGINTDVGDAFGQPNGKGGTIYPTDAPRVNTIADHVLQNATQPHYVATLQAAGIDPADPHAKDKLVDIITKQNNGYGRALTDFSSRLDANVEQKKIRDYGPERMDIAERSAERADRREARIEAALLGKNNEPGAEPTNITIPYKGGTANVEAQNYVPLSISKKNFAGSPAYSLTDGKPVKALESSGDYEVVGVGNFPFIKGTGTSADGTIAQPNYVKQNGQHVQQKPMVHVQKVDPDTKELQDYVIDYDKLPANIKNSKPVKQALSNFHSAVTGQQAKPAATPAQQAGGMIKVKLPNGTVGTISADKLHDFQRDYPGAQKID